MQKQKKADTPIGRPGLTPESRERQLISYAENLAEKQLKEGTASSAIIVHYLRLGTAKQKLEIEKLRNETALLEAKTKAIESGERTEALYREAVEAMKLYSGTSDAADL